MIIAPRGEQPPASERRTATFTGEVWATPMIGAEGTTVASVTFAPGARTFWHHHEHGQFLHVVAGSGLICTQGETPRRLRAGDIVWVPPGETHWHGGCAESGLTHLAVSLGTTQWADEVDERDYAATPAEHS